MNKMAETKVGMTERELSSLRSIIRALQDIHDSVSDGRRNRHFAIDDLKVDANYLKALILNMEMNKYAL
jgi:hypothetical protein